MSASSSSPHCLAQDHLEWIQAKTSSLRSIELMPLAISAMDNFDEHQQVFSKLGVFSSLATILQPKSRGTIRLSDSDPHSRPKVDFGLLSDPADLLVARKAVRLSLKLGAVMKASGFPIIRNLTLPAADEDADVSEEELDRFIRQRARTTYHYASTCRMASENDPKAPGVVDDSLRVHGIANLRVCDASVFPQITSAHLQAPVAMVAEKCADMIKSLYRTS